MRHDKWHGAHQGFILIVFLVFLLVEAVTVAATLLFIRAPRSDLVWTAMGFLNWAEAALFGYALATMTGAAKASGATRAVVGYLLGVYTVIGLLTILAYDAFTGGRGRLAPLSALLLLETVAVSASVLVLSGYERKRALLDADGHRLANRAAGLAAELAEVKAKFPALRRGLPGSLTELGRLEKRVDAVIARLKHAGTGRKDEAACLTASAAISALARAAEGNASSSDDSERVTAMENQLLNLDDLVGRIIK